MAAETADRVDATVDAVPGEVIAPVRQATPGIRVIFLRRLQLVANTMAVAAEALRVTQAADRLVLSGPAAVTFDKRGGVIENPVGKGIVRIGFVAGAADAQVFTFVNMARGQSKSAGGCRGDPCADQHGCQTESVKNTYEAKWAHR